MVLPIGAMPPARAIKINKLLNDVRLESSILNVSKSTKAVATSTKFATKRIVQSAGLLPEIKLATAVAADPPTNMEA